mgnify:CR=1 FL=1
MIPGACAVAGLPRARAAACCGGGPDRSPGSASMKPSERPGLQDRDQAGRVRPRPRLGRVAASASSAPGCGAGHTAMYRRDRGHGAPPDSSSRWPVGPGHCHRRVQRQARPRPGRAFSTAGNRAGTCPSQASRIARPPRREELASQRMPSVVARVIKYQPQRGGRVQAGMRRRRESRQRCRPRGCCRSPGRASSQSQASR